MTVYYQRPDGSVGAAIDEPVEGEAHQRLLAALESVYGELEEVDEATYRESERKWEADQ